MTHEVTEQERQTTIETLFQRHYTDLRDLAAEDPRLLAPDADNILQGLAARLAQYDGQLDDESFLLWAADIIGGAVERIGFFYSLQRECRESIRVGIWMILSKNIDLIDNTNSSFVIRQIEQNTLQWAWDHLDDLMETGSAKLSTRLAAQAKFQTLTWRKSRLRDNDKFHDADIERFGSEPFHVESGVLYFDTSKSDDGDADEQVQRPKSRSKKPPSDSLMAMKSGKPRLFCPSCKFLQAISPDPASDQSAIRLWCGHERPAALSAA